MEFLSTAAGVAIIGVIGGLLGAWVNSLLHRGKEMAEIETIESEANVSEAAAAQVVNDIQLSWIIKQEKRIAGLEENVKDLQQENKDLTLKMDSVMEDARADRQAYIYLEKQYAGMKEQMREWNKGIKKLIEQLKDNGLDPAWSPEGD